jgi:hypothetical protein
VFLVGATTSAQCRPQWLPGDGLPGADNPVLATTRWDPDALGPRSPRLVVGGSFSVMGSVAANCIAAFDPATSAWSALGSGIGGNLVSALAVPASPDVVEIAISNAGAVDAQLALPNTPSLAAIVLHQQLVALEFDDNRNFEHNTSTNALITTIGTS